MDEKDDVRQTAAYVETGGLRWGATFMQAYNVTWPFARIEISRERIQLTAKFWGMVDVKFDLDKSELLGARKRNGLFTAGVQFEHQKSDYPPMLLFWTSNQDTLIEELQRLDYPVLDAPK